MTCFQCEPEDCIAPEGSLCKNSGNFYTTNEYSKTIEYFDIHGVSFSQKVDSVKHLLDYNTIQILKALFADNQCPNDIDYLISLQVYGVLDFIQSRLSNDNTNENFTRFHNNSFRSRGDDK